MTEWIKASEQLPMLGQTVRVKHRTHGRIKERDAVWDYRGTVPAFFLTPSWCIIPDQVEEWRAVEATEVKGQKQRRKPYQISPEGRASKSERMKQYWKQRRESAA